MHLIEGAYHHDILAQPDALAHTLDALVPLPAERLARIHACEHRRIVLTGMGSSFHALYPLYLRLLELGFAAVHVETAELCLSMPGLTKDALVIVVSQSGRSAETLELLDRLESGAELLGITNDASSPLAARADQLVLLQAGREATVSCKTYLATLLALEWLGAAFAGESLDGARAELFAAPGLVAGYLSTWRQAVADLAERVRNVEQFYFTGRGRSLAAVGTSGLIFKEATRRPGEAMSSAAFRHGPLEVLGPGVLVVTFAGKGAASKLNERLVADVLAAGAQAELVSPAARFSPFRLPVASPRLGPLLEILPIQLLTLAVAAIAGREAGTFRLASKITLVA